MSKKPPPVQVTTQTERFINGCISLVAVIMFLGLVVGLIVTGLEKMF